MDLHRRVLAPFFCQGPCVRLDIIRADRPAHACAPGIQSRRGCARADDPKIARPKPCRSLKSGRGGPFDNMPERFQQASRSFHSRNIFRVNSRYIWLHRLEPFEEGVVREQTNGQFAGVAA